MGFGRIILHVGAPKTGSTYLQRRLRSAPEAVRSSGLYVPVLPSVQAMAGNAKLLATVLSDAPSRSFTRTFPGIDTIVLSPADVFAELIGDWRSADEALLLSAENFRPKHASRLRSLIPANTQVTVALFVRAQDAWFESYYNQLIKTRDIQQDLPSFIDDVLACLSDRYCTPDWLYNYEVWRKSFGDCRIILYEEHQDNLFNAFFDALDLPIPKDVPDIDRQQESMDLFQLMYLMRVAPDKPFDVFYRRRLASAEASRRILPPKARILTRQDSDRLSDLYESSNQKLMGLLGRATGGAALVLMRPPCEGISLEREEATEAYQSYRALADEIFQSASSLLAAGSCLA